jgi:hypothetical protein
MVYLGNGDDAWEQTCTVDDGGGTPTTRCLSRVGTGNYYDVYGEWLGRGTWTFTGFPCQPGDFLVQGYVQ